MKVLIIGLGSIAKKHISSLNRLYSNVQFYALRRVESMSDKYEGVENILELTSDFDFAIISNPTSEHATTIEKLREYQFPLFIEKPLFSDLGNEKIVENVLNDKISTYVACNLRFLDCIDFIKNNIKNKRINEVNIYCGSYLPDWRPLVDFRKVYSAHKELGGGVHIDLIHEIDYMVYLFGFPNRVFRQFRNNSSLKISSTDYSNYLFDYEVFSASVILNYYRRTAKRTLEILCDDGEYFVDLLKNEVYWNQNLIFHSKNRIIDTYDKQMRFFVEEVVLSGRINQMNNILEASKILKLCLED